MNNLIQTYQIRLLLDTPIKSIAYDKLGRKPIVGNIAAAIINRSRETHNCYTIGIYGKWGEGKTSVLEMVCELIEEDDNNNLEVIRFNPWLFKDEESLLLDFFSTLQNGVTSKDVVDKIKQYGHWCHSDFYRADSFYERMKRDLEMNVNNMRVAFFSVRECEDRV